METSTDNDGKPKETRITNIKVADENHRVISVTNGRGSYRKRPCAECPWRKDAAGVFPAEAFRLSAHTAYDMAEATFGCHEAGHIKPATCAGFLLNGANHNLTVRLGRMKGKYLSDVTDGGNELHASYREMAIANGVEPGDSVLENCRE